jgi:serine/threonine protein kinase
MVSTEPNKKSKKDSEKKQGSKKDSEKKQGSKMDSEKKSSSIKSSSFSSPEKHKLLDSGTYGCVVMPPFDNKHVVHKVIMPYKNKQSSDIAKIFKRGENDFNEEVKLIEKIEKIDPKNKFTTKMKGSMIINGKKVDDENIQICLIDKKVFDTYQTIVADTEYMNNHYYQLILENGGVRTDKTYSLTYPEFVSKFKVFIQGMLRLQEQNLVHLDIKPANVLISDKKINLIDFGLMSEFDELFTEQFQHILEYSKGYIYYPPEFYLAHLYLELYNFIPSQPTILNLWTGRNRIELETFLEKSIINRNVKLKQQYEKGIQEHYDIIAKKIEDGVIEISELFPKEIAMKADVYSISYIITALNKNITFSNNDAEKTMQQEFIDKIHEKCFESNPYKRITMKELYDLINQEYKFINKSSSKSSSKSNQKLTKGSKSSKTPKTSKGGNLKLKRSKCSMIPKYMLRVEMDPVFKQRALDIKKGKVSL